MSVMKFFFAVYPYICLTVFVVASWIRYDHEQYTWKTDSSMLLSKSNMVFASNFFHIGAMALIGGTVLWARRMFNPRIRATSRFTDSFVISWLMLTLIFGLATLPFSVGHAGHGDPSVMLALAE